MARAGVFPAISAFVFDALGAIAVFRVRSVMIVAMPGMEFTFAKVPVGYDGLTRILPHSLGKSNFVIVVFTNNYPVMRTIPTSFFIRIVLTAVLGKSFAVVSFTAGAIQSNMAMTSAITLTNTSAVNLRSTIRLFDNFGVFAIREANASLI